MSTHIYTDLWLSPGDYEKPKVRTLLDEADASFEFEDEDDDDRKPDDEGMIRLYMAHAALDDLTELSKMGVAFQAREDSRLESDGNQAVLVSYRKRMVYMQEDGAGCPVARVGVDGKVNTDDLKSARLYWRLRAKVVAACRKKLEAKS